MRSSSVKAVFMYLLQDECIVVVPDGTLERPGIAFPRWSVGTMMCVSVGTMMFVTWA